MRKKGFCSLLTSLILGLYYKLNWPKRASAVYWLLGILLYPCIGQVPPSSKYKLQQTPKNIFQNPSPGRTHPASILMRDTKYAIQNTTNHKRMLNKFTTRPHTSWKHPDERYKIKNTTNRKRMLNKSTTRPHTSCQQPDDKYKIQNTTNNKRMVNKSTTRPHTSCKQPDDMRVPSTGNHTGLDNLQVRRKTILANLWNLSEPDDFDGDVFSSGNANPSGDSVVRKPGPGLHRWGGFCLSRDWTVYSPHCRYARPGGTYFGTLSIPAWTSFSSHLLRKNWQRSVQVSFCCKSFSVPVLEEVSIILLPSQASLSPSRLSYYNHILNHHHYHSHGYRLHHLHHRYHHYTDSHCSCSKVMRQYNSISSSELKNLSLLVVELLCLQDPLQVLIVLDILILIRPSLHH